MNRSLPVSRTAVAGLSLLELMIALAIGLVLMLGLVQVMSASQAAYHLSSGVARTQENARFAMESLQRDLRMAGHLGCVNDQARMQAGNEGIHLKFLADGKNYVGASVQTRFDMGIQGFEANNTAPAGSFTMPALPVAGAANAWVPALPDAIKALNPVSHSDILILRYLAPAGVGLVPAGFAVSGTAGGVVGGINATLTPANASTEVTRGLIKDATALFGIADCAQATIFAGSLSDVASGAVKFAASIAGTNKSGFTGLEAYEPSQANLYRAESLVYYVAVGAGGGPSLFRASVNGAGTYVSEELVEGVESMQLLYGRDESVVSVRPTGYISRNSVASSIGAAATVPNTAQADDWRRVGMVQIGLLMRSSEPAAAVQATNNPSVLGVSVTPPTTGGHYRSVYETSVALRNRLYGN